MLLSRLARLLRRAFNRILPRARALDDPTTRQVEELLSRSYLEGQRAGRLFHAHSLGLPKEVNRAQLRSIRIRAREHALAFSSQLTTSIKAGKVSRIQAQNISGVSARLGVWHGQDDAASDAAEEAGTPWKRWVRVFPRKLKRDWHDALEGQTLPEDELFVLPGGPNAGAACYGPRDWDRIAQAGEWANCGHALQYLRQVSANDFEFKRFQRN